MKPKISIIIPTKNEEQAIAKVICSIPKKILEVSEIIVADSSNDLTPIIAKRLGAKVLRIKGGKGKAMKVAAKKAKGEILVFLDGDGTDDPKYIPKALNLLKKCDIVHVARHYKKGVKVKNPIIRASWILYISFMISFWKLLGLNFKGDPLAGFRVLKKETWEKMKLKSNDFLIESEMNLKAKKLNLKICEILAPILPRIGGTFSSKFLSNPKQISKYFSFCLKYMTKENKIKAKEIIRKFKKSLEKLLLFYENNRNK